MTPEPRTDIPADVEPYPGQAPCPHCFESSGYAARVHPSTWNEPAWADSDPTQPCPYCNATGTVDSPLATLEDLEELAAEDDGQPTEAQEWHDYDPDC